MKLLAGILGGLIFAVLGASMVPFLIAANNYAAQWHGIILIALWIVAFFFCKQATSSRQAWSQIIAGIGFMLFILPIVLINTVPDLVNSPGKVRSDADVISGTVTMGLSTLIYFLLALVCAFVSKAFGKEKNSCSIRADLRLYQQGLREREKFPCNRG